MEHSQTKQWICRTGLGTLALAMLVGCSTPVQERKVTKSGFLNDYSQFHEGGEGQASLVYINPDVKFSTYQKIMFDPVQLLLKKDSKLTEVPKEEQQELVNYLSAALREQLKKDYTIVDAPGPDVMRLRVAITDGNKGKVVMNTVSSIVPIGLAVDLVKYAATGTHMSVGEASIEVDIVDSVSGTRLMAAVDARSGRKSVVSGNFHKWDDVQDAYDHWANQIRERLARLRSE